MEEIVYSVVSDAPLINETAACTDIEEDHTYDAAEFQKQADSKQQSQYNTSLHCNTGNSKNWDAYSKTCTWRNDQQYSQLGKQLQNCFPTDESGVITTEFNQAYNIAVSDTTLDNTTTTAVADSHWHYISDTVGFYNDQVDILCEQRQYNTWQHGSNTSINKCDLRFGMDLCTGNTNKIEYDDVVTVNEDYPHSYTDMTDEVKPREYKVVCQNPNVTQEKRPTSEYVYFNEGMYVNDDIEMSPTENENHPHTYVNEIEKTNQELAQYHVYEVVYHKPSATQDENSTSMHANFDDGKHSGTVSKVRGKAQPGKDIVESTSNEMLQTMHNAFKSPLEEASCTDVNAYLELQSHEEDTEVHFNVQEYSDTVGLECMDDETANNQRKMKDSEVDIYEVFNDVKYA